MQFVYVPGAGFRADHETKPEKCHGLKLFGSHKTADESCIKIRTGMAKNKFIQLTTVLKLAHLFLSIRWHRSL